MTEFDEEVTATVIEQNTCYASAVSMVDCAASRRISRYWFSHTSQSHFTLSLKEYKTQEIRLFLAKSSLFPFRKFGLIEERPILDVGGYRVPLVLHPSKVKRN